VYSLSEQYLAAASAVKQHVLNCMYFLTLTTYLLTLGKLSRTLLISLSRV
jgi:hypothetical protein